MALRQQHSRVLASEQRKKEDATVVRKFFYEERDPEVEQEVAADSAPQEAIKFRFAFDPPEDLRHSGAPDRLDTSMRTSLLQRAEELTKRGVHVTIKDATSLEQRRQKEEAAYASFEELQAQQEEIYNMKVAMELENQDSNFDKIHTLLFGPRPEDCGPLGDWDVYERVQQHVRQFAYARPSCNDAEQDETTQKLQERLHFSGEQIDSQRRRIRELTLSLRTSAQEISSLKTLLAEKNDELTQFKQKAALLQSQMKHLKDASGASVSGRRQSSVSRDSVAPSGQSKESHQELLDDFQQLVNANLQLEQENILLRARVAVRGGNTDELKVALEAKASFSAADLKEKERRRKVLDAVIPSSSAVIKLKISRAAWLARQGRLACDALAGHDTDAGVELIRKPSYDVTRRQPQQPMKRVVKQLQQEKIPLKTKEPAVDAVHAVAAATVAPTQEHDDPSEEHAGMEAVPHSPLWHSLQKRILGCVAVSRADSLRREQAHIAKLRHRIAVLSSDVSELRCDRDAALSRAEKVSTELHESKAMLDDVVARCESLSKALEESHHASIYPTSDRAGGPLVGIAANRRKARQSDVLSQGADSDRARCKSLEEKLSSFSEIMNERVSELENELSDTREALNAAQMRLARDGPLYSTPATTHVDGPHTVLATPRVDFEQKKHQEECGAVRLIISADDDDGDVEPQPQLRSAQVDAAPSLVEVPTAKYEREISSLSTELKFRTRHLAIAERRLGAAESELASMKIEKQYGMRSNVAHLIAPKLRGALHRARLRLLDAEPQPQKQPQRQEALDDDEQTIARLVSLVEPDSQAYSVVLRQQHHRRRLQHFVSPPSNGVSQVLSGTAELRLQWLKLLSSREKQLRLCSAPAMQQALIELLRETYEDAMECEQVCTAGRRNEAILGRAAKHFVEWSSNRERDDSAMEMRDIRSLEQLEREQLAWSELLHAHLQLARDIESKRSDIIANESTDVVIMEKNRQERPSTGLTFCFEATGRETASSIAAYFGFAAPSMITWSCPELQPALHMIVPVISATVADILKSVYSTISFSVRHTMSSSDTFETVAARFSAAVGHVSPCASAGPRPLCVDVYCNATEAVRALRRDPHCAVTAHIKSDRPIDPSVISKLLNISQSTLAEHNSLAIAGERVHIPFQLNSNNASSLAQFVANRNVALVHMPSKHESAKSISVKYNVDVSDVVGYVGDGVAVEVIVASIDALSPHVSSSWLEGLAKQPTVLPHVVEGSKLLSEIAKAASVPRWRLRVPNLDVVDFIHAEGSRSAEHLVRCREIEQVQFAVANKFSLLARSMDGTEEYIHSDVDQALSSLMMFDTIHAIVELPTWDRAAAAATMGAHVSDVQPWELMIDATQVPIVGIVQHTAPNVEYVVAFSTRLPRFGKLPVEQFDDLLRNVQQDIVEIVAFACPTQSLLRCAVPFLEEQSSTAYLQIVTSSAEDAQSVRALIEKDGSVSELSHLRSALLDFGLSDGGKILLDVVGDCSVTPISHSSLHHNVSGDESLGTVALRYGVRITSLIQANASVWLRSQQAVSGRKNRRRVQIGDDDGSTVDVTLRPLRSFDIRVLQIPCGLPQADFVIKSIATDRSMSLLQLSSLCGVPSDRVFMDVEHVEWSAGTVLRIPPRPAVRNLATRRVIPMGTKRLQHVVDGRGDTPGAVAARYQMTVEELLRENANSVMLPRGFVATFVETGMAPPQYSVEHRLTDNDTLNSIARRYRVAPQDVVQWNPWLRGASYCDVVIAPLMPEVVEVVLAEQFPNVVCFVTDIPLPSIAKTFDCSLDEIVRLNEIVGAAVHAKKAVPLTSAGAVALAKRQRLETFALVPLGAESVLSTAERAECHISAVLFNQKKIEGPQTLRILVSAETAAMFAGSGQCAVENARLSLFPPSRILVGARTVALRSPEEVMRFQSSLQLQFQKQSGLAQRQHFLDDRLVDVGSRLAMIQMNLRKVDSMIEARHAAGEHVAKVSINCDSIGVQTDAVEEQLPEALVVTRVRIPMHERQSQTNLTGEAVEESLFSISAAQGKEVLLETELQEARSDKQKLEMLVKASAESQQALEEQNKRLSNHIQAFQLRIAAIEGATKESLSQPLTPRSVAEVAVATEHVPLAPVTASQYVLATNVDNAPASLPDSASLSNAAKSFLIPRPATSTSATHDVAVQVEPSCVPKRTQTAAEQTTADIHRQRPEKPLADEVPLLFCPQVDEQPHPTPRRTTLSRLVHVDQSRRDNELAPKSSKEPLCIAFTDIQSSTSLWNRAPDEMADAVDQHHHQIRQLLRVHSGYEVKTIGDSFMVAFKSPVDAIDFSVELQRQLFNASWPKEVDEIYHALAAEASQEGDVTRDDRTLWNGLRVRVGLNVGLCNPRLDSVTGGYDYYGTLVNTAARVEGVGHGGQVLATDAMIKALQERNYNFGKLVVQSLGPQPLRGLDEPVVLHQFSPPELAGRQYAELRIDRGNEMTDEALALSITSTAAVQEAQLRAQKAEEAANRATEALSLERHRSQILAQREAAFSTSNSSASSPTIQAAQSPFAHPQAAPASAITRRVKSYTSAMTQTSPNGFQSPSSGSRLMLRQSLTNPVSTAAIRDDVRRTLASFWQYADQAISSSFQAMINLCTRDLDAQVVSHSENTAQAISSSLQSAILQRQLQQKGDPEQKTELSQDQLFAIHEVLKHSATPSPGDEGRLPSVVVPSVATKPQIEMRRSTVSKLKEDETMQPLGSAPQLVKLPPIQSKEADPAHSQETPVAGNVGSMGDLIGAKVLTEDNVRGCSVAQRRSTMQLSLTKSLLNKDTDRIATPPFAPPITLQAGTMFSGRVVSHAAEAQLERVRQKVENEVLSVLRLDFFDNPPAVSNTLRSISLPKTASQVEAVRLFREEQIEIRRERRRLMAQRLGTRYRLNKLLQRIQVTDAGTPHVVTSLWKKWLEGVTVRQGSLRTRERSNVAQLISALSAPSIPGVTHGSAREMEYAPWHVTRYEVPANKQRGPAPLEPLAPRSAPDAAKMSSSSMHFRFARFQ